MFDSDPISLLHTSQSLQLALQLDILLFATYLLLCLLASMYVVFVSHIQQEEIDHLNVISSHICHNL